MRTASLDSSSPAPRPRNFSSTTTSSIRARSPVGSGNITRVSIPAIVPSQRATSRVMAGDALSAVMSEIVSGAAELESCGSSRPNAVTTSSSMSPSTST